MLPNGIEPPLKMLTNAQKIHATDRLLQDLTKCEKALSVPGNYHAKQRRRFHDDSKLVFPENKTRKNREDFETHYNSNFQRYQPCRPRERPCSPTRRNNPHPSKVTYILFNTLIPLSTKPNLQLFPIKKK